MGWLWVDGNHHVNIWTAEEWIVESLYCWINMIWVLLTPTTELPMRYIGESIIPSLAILPRRVMSPSLLITIIVSPLRFCGWAEPKRDEGEHGGWMVGKPRAWRYPRKEDNKWDSLEYTHSTDCSNQHGGPTWDEILLLPKLPQSSDGFSVPSDMIGIEEMTSPVVVFV